MKVPKKGNKDMKLTKQQQADLARTQPLRGARDSVVSAVSDVFLTMVDCTESETMQTQAVQALLECTSKLREIIAQYDPAVD
jgi:hypothetical protein